MQGILEEQKKQTSQLAAIKMETAFNTAAIIFNIL